MIKTRSFLFLFLVVGVILMAVGVFTMLTNPLIRLGFGLMLMCMVGILIIAVLDVRAASSKAEEPDLTSEEIQQAFQDETIALWQQIGLGRFADQMNQMGEETDDDDDA